MEMIKAVKKKLQTRFYITEGRVLNFNCYKIEERRLIFRRTNWLNGTSKSTGLGT